MNRAEKEQTVSDLRARFARAKVALVASAEGLTVAKTQELRRAIRAAGGEYKVTKNSLTRLALGSTEFAPMEALLRGPTGMVLGYEDPVAVTKVLVKFVEANEKLSIKAAVLDRRVLGAAEVKDLASLPGREALISMLLGLMQAPATQLLRTVQEPGASLTRVIDQVRIRLDQPG